MQIFLGIVVLCLIGVVLVILYGMYQENQYRKEVFKQFGNSNKDVLLDDPVTQVRDGEPETFYFSEAAQNKKQVNEEAVFANTTTVENKPNKKDTGQIISDSEMFTPSHLSQDIEGKSKKLDSHFDLKTSSSKIADNLTKTTSGKTVKIKDPIQDSLDLEGLNTVEEQQVYAKRLSSKDSIVSKIEKIFPKKSTKVKKTHYKVSVKELEQLDLPWFNKCFDYMAYVTLDEAKELHVLPRLSSKHRFNIAAYNLDEQFQIAEPIPGVKYKAYIIGLQAISRSGLASKNDLSLFGKNVQDFAKSVGGTYCLTDVDKFYEIARPMDELCARVDQIIGLHLVSRESISGIDLRANLEKNDFTLSHDGAFYYPNPEEELFKVVNMKDAPFTPSLLASDNFKGFSILFDITRVPPGGRNFDKFMGLAVKLANELRLDLVDDQLEELSTDWLKTIKDYVLERQKEMEAVGIIPGEGLAKRLFA